MCLRARLLIVIALGWILSGCNAPLSDADIEATLGLTPITHPQSTSYLPSHISGRVWHDLCAAPGEDQEVPDQVPQGCITVDGGFQADGVYNQHEPGIKDVVVSLGKGTCPSAGFAESLTNVDGVFTFLNIDPGPYCVTVDPTLPRNAQMLAPGKWTSDPSAGSSSIARTINLTSDREITDIAFGWDFQFQPPFSASTVETAGTPTRMPPPTGTPLPVDPDLPTEDADYVDLMINPGNWFGAGVSIQEDEHIRFELANSRMKMTAFAADLYESWRLSWPDIGDFYLDATFEVEECAGKDRYGLFTRGTNIEDNPHGYLFGITCDGHYSLRIFDGEFSTLIDWTKSEHINSGSDQTNLLGFWANGDTLRLYINGNRVAEILDDTFESGPFGLFIGSAETENFTAEVDFMSYWLLP